MPLPKHTNTANPQGATNHNIPRASYTLTDADGILSLTQHHSFPTNATSVIIGGVTHTTAPWPARAYQTFYSTVVTLK